MHLIFPIAINHQTRPPASPCALSFRHLNSTSCQSPVRSQSTWQQHLLQKTNTLPSKTDKTNRPATDGDTRNLKSCAAAARHVPKPCINVPQPPFAKPPVPSPRKEVRTHQTPAHDVAGCLKQRSRRRRKCGWAGWYLFCLLVVVVGTAGRWGLFGARW